MIKTGRRSGADDSATISTHCVTGTNGRSLIVCVADKMLSFGEYLQWDSDITKIIKINRNSVALMAGSVAHCEAILAILLPDTDFGKNINAAASFLRQAYENKFAMFQDTEVLHRNGIDRDLYKQMLISTQTPRVLERLVEDMQEFAAHKWDCDLMICGFDENKSAYIMSVSAPGNVVVQTIQGYYSIGIASEKAHPVVPG